MARSPCPRPRALRPAANGTPYLAQIDGLRALALLLVVVWHEALRGVRQVEALNAQGYGLPSPYDYVPHGEIGVDLFFVISGFVIAQPFLGRPPAQWRIGEFYRRRLYRLYPPYLAVLAVGFLAAMTGLVHDRDVHGIPQWQSFAASLTYLHGWVFDRQSRFDPPLWSLEIEVQFYAIVPFVMRLYGRVKGPLTRAGGGLGAGRGADAPCLDAARRPAFRRALPISGCWPTCTCSCSGSWRPIWCGCGVRWNGPAPGGLTSPLWAAARGCWRSASGRPPSTPSPRASCPIC